MRFTLRDASELIETLTQDDSAVQDYRAAQGERHGSAHDHSQTDDRYYYTER